MTGPHASYILDPRAHHAALEDYQRRKARNRERDHGRWIYGQRRKKRKQRHRDEIAAASRKRNRR